MPYEAPLCPTWHWQERFCQVLCWMPHCGIAEQMCCQHKTSNSWCNFIGRRRKEDSWLRNYEVSNFAGKYDFCVRLRLLLSQSIFEKSLKLGCTPKTNLIKMNLCTILSSVATHRKPANVKSNCNFHSSKRKSVEDASRFALGSVYYVLCPPCPEICMVHVCCCRWQVKEDRTLPSHWWADYTPFFAAHPITVDAR